MSDLYATIAELSYAGDPRMSAGAEDPDKVKKLVGAKGALERWEGLYGNFIEEIGDVVSRSSGEGVEWEYDNESARERLFGLLPDSVRSKARSNEGPKIASAIESIVATSAGSQSVKGLLTAGPWRSLVYAWDKLRKGVLK